MSDLSAHTHLKTKFQLNQETIPVRVVWTVVTVVLLLPPPVPVNQLAEIGCLLAVFDDELVFEQLLGCGTLQDKKTDCNFFLFYFFLKRDKKQKTKKTGHDVISL